jgi:hypothetical protein
VQVDEIHFNHDPASASGDALTIRRNAGGSPIVAPEWRRGAMPQPCAYAAAALGATVTIRARLSGGPRNRTVRVRAIDARIRPRHEGGVLGWLLDLLCAFARLFFGNVLGDVAARPVAFDASGRSGLETFVLAHPRLRTAGVGRRTTEWAWQRRAGCAWKTFDLTLHEVYLVLDVPRGPWTQTASGNDPQLPWTDALDRACVFALGARTRDEAAAAVARAVNGQILQSYTPVTMFGFLDYRLSDYLAKLAGGVPFVLNCTDCADAVTTLANLLGCDLFEGRFFNMVTRKFLTLGGDPTVGSDWVSWSWGYHEIAWLSQIGPNERVYDGCLQLDVDDDYTDAVHTPKLAVRMPFGSSGPGDYRYRLIESGTGQLENVPRRRSVS